MLSEDIIKRRGKTITNKTPLSVEIKKSIYMLIFTLLSIITLISIVYLLNSSQSTQKGYSLKQQQLEKDELIEQSRDLIRKLINAESSNNIQNNPIVKQMVKPTNLIYLDQEKSSNKTINTKTH